MGFMAGSQVSARERRQPGDPRHGSKGRTKRRL